MQSLPNILTLSRVLVIPIVVGMFYIDGALARWATCALFIAAAVTDFFDGYLARSMNQTSRFGQFLDPIADKLLVAAVLFMLAAFDRLGCTGIIPAVIILCREVLVSGLREFLAEIRVCMPVTKLAKWKTTFQLIALPLLILGDSVPASLHATVAGEAFLWLAAVLTFITGYDYLKGSLKYMGQEK